MLRLPELITALLFALPALAQDQCHVDRRCACKFRTIRP